MTSAVLNKEPPCLRFVDATVSETISRQTLINSAHMQKKKPT